MLCLGQALCRELTGRLKEKVVSIPQRGKLRLREGGSWLIATCAACEVRILPGPLPGEALSDLAWNCAVCLILWVEKDIKIKGPRGLMSPQEPRGSYRCRVKFQNWCEAGV